MEVAVSDCTKSNQRYLLITYSDSPTPSSADNAACIPSSFTRSITFPLLNSATLVIPVAPERMIVTLAVGKPPARMCFNHGEASTCFSSAFTLRLFASLIPNALYTQLWQQ